LIITLVADCLDLSISLTLQIDKVGHGEVLGFFAYNGTSASFQIQTSAFAAVRIAELYIPLLEVKRGQSIFTQYIMPALS